MLLDEKYVMFHNRVTFFYLPTSRLSEGFIHTFDSAQKFTRDDDI